MFYSGNEQINQEPKDPYELPVMGTQANKIAVVMGDKWEYSEFLDAITNQNGVTKKLRRNREGLVICPLNPSHMPMPEHEISHHLILFHPPTQKKPSPQKPARNEKIIFSSSTPRQYYASKPVDHSPSPAHIVKKSPIKIFTDETGKYVCPFDGLHLMPKTSLKKHFLTQHFQKMNIYRFDSDRCILTSIEQEQEQQGQKQQQNTNQPSQASPSLRGPIKFAGGTPAEPKKTNPIPAFDEWEAEPENDQYGYEQGDDNNNNNNNNLTYVSQDSLYQKPQENWGYNNPNNNYALPQLPQQPQIQSQIQQDRKSVV